MINRNSIVLAAFLSAAALLLPVHAAQAAPVIVSFTADRSLPVPAGTSVTWTVVAAGAGPLEYQFWRYDITTGQWTVAQSYTSSNTHTWSSGVWSAGSYLLQVWVRSGGSTDPEAWQSTPPFAITAPKPRLTPVIVTGSARTDGTMTFEANTRGGGAVAPGFQFLLYDLNAGTWERLQFWTANRILNWAPRRSGTFLVQVQVSTDPQPQLNPPDDAMNTEPFTVTAAPLVVTLDVDRGFPMAPGTHATWTVGRTGGEGEDFRFKFWRYSVANGQWTVLREYGFEPWFVWDPGPAEQGTYVIQVWVRAAGSTADYDAFASTGYFEISSTYPATAQVEPFDRRLQGGRMLRVSGKPSSGGTNRLEYRWWLQTNGGSWTSEAYHPNGGVLRVTPTVGNTYRAQLWVRSTGSTASYDDYYDTGEMVALEQGPRPEFPLASNIAGTLPVGTALSLVAGPLPYDHTLEGTYVEYVFNRRSPSGVWTILRDERGTGNRWHGYGEVLGGCSAAPCAPVETGEYVIEVYRYLNSSYHTYMTFRYILVESQ